jgi:polyphosphate kinase
MPKSSYINRELSWLEFNQRVLNEALRDDLPVLERLKFLAITGSNLDEFFQVRVGSLQLQQRGGRGSRAGAGPAQQLAAIRKRVLRLVEDQYALLNETLLPALAEKGIHPTALKALTARQRDQLARVFAENIFPLLTPLAVSEDQISVVPGLRLILACRVVAESGTPRFVLLPVPESLGRRVPVADDEEGACRFVLIEDLVAAHAGELFPGEKVTATACFRATRNGDIAVQEEDATDLAGEMEEVLTARRFSDTVRLEMPKSCPRDLAGVIRQVCAAAEADIYRCPGPLALSSLMEIALMPGFDDLRAEEWPAQASPAIEPGASIFSAISHGDILLHHPYESFEPVIRLVEEAAGDPDTLAIKQVLYRTAKNSRIIDALIRAAEKGIHVTVLVELKARFDEARNLDRAEELQRAGAQIVYGVKGLKTHAKICLVVRREEGRLKRYVHLGTGNYNEATSRLYTDISYLTCRADYGADASLFFNALTGRSKLLRFHRLVPAPTEMKRRLLELIASETERAEQGEEARIVAKINSLQDEEMIDALYKASRAGVRVQLNVRGICCLKPDDGKRSKNIEVISVVDRFLEHARILYFHHGGDPQVFISSADWMSRNLDRRIELMTPIEDPAAKRRLVRILEAYFQDNIQASRLLADGTSQRLAPKKGESPFRVQQGFYDEARKAAKAREHERATSFEPHRPAAEPNA